MVLQELKLKIFKKKKKKKLLKKGCVLLIS